jgi:hypothetical protein
MSDCNSFLDFQKLYRNKCPRNHCFGKGEVGKEYVCPVVGQGGLNEPEMNQWFRQQQQGRVANCHAPIEKLGRNRATKCGQGQQKGGGEYVKYTADGRVVTGLEANSMCGCQRSKSQKGGGGDLIDNTPKYPRDTCGCRRSDGCGYTKYNTHRQYGNIQREVPGVYFDMCAAPVGNRPTHNEHDNHMKMSTECSAKFPDGKSNLANRNFGCQQPFWCKDCL